MIDFSTFLQYARETGLDAWADRLPQDLEQGLSPARWGDLPDWLAAMRALPTGVVHDYDFTREVRLGRADEIADTQRTAVRRALQALIPWRKGPYSVCGIHIDTEWRSDWKWQRLAPHISSLRDRLVLDVGCGNGYHCWRMLGADAARVVGIDPSPRFVVQFYMLKKLLALELPVDVLPLALEQLPPRLKAFDTTFSMGVFYHRRSPMDHLRDLQETLKPGGELVLETLVIEGKQGEVLVPEGRYAQMNNVWFLPSCPTLTAWLRKTGWRDVRCVDVSLTTTEEQRSTDWMKFHSLPDFLDPQDSSRTLEGYPAPRRAIFVARCPD